MEEAAWLVTRSDSETSARGFGTMTYNDDKLTAALGFSILLIVAGEANAGAGEPDTVARSNNAGGAAISAGDAAPDNESGELLTAGDACALDSFHEDAIAQAGCGPSQALVVLASGLAVGGAALELAAVPFILPSAEIELCILPHENSWLVLISLVGCATGAVSWGALASRLGRRRALMSALAVNAVFAAVAAFMPTYGTFMMARFCSAIGSGGIVPTTFTYCGELSPRSCRSRALAWLVLGAGGGALLAAVLARAILPPTGALTLSEDSEHFSAWHRYLLLCTLPILAALVLLIWTPESPRYLLDVGREVDAMTTYQSIHSSNQIRLCGKANVAAANNRAPSYHLGELSLPGKRRHLPHCKHSLQMFWVSIFQLFSSSYRRVTLCLGGILLLTTVLQLYLSSYVPSVVTSQSQSLFAASRRSVRHESLHGEHLNTTLENVHYYNTTFTHCTFRDMLISHVLFENCSFLDVAFSNIKTSYTTFEGCLLVNTTIIDTDIEVGRELDEWCVLNNTVLRGLQAGCARRADLNSRLEPAAREQSYVSHAMLIASVLALLPQRLRPTVVLCGLCVLLSPSVYVCRSETALYCVEAVYRALLTLIFFNASVSVVDTYPAHHRCTAHGLMLTVAYSGGAIVRGVGSGGAIVSCVLCALLAGSATLLAVRGR